MNTQHRLSLVAAAFVAIAFIAGAARASELEDLRARVDALTTEVRYLRDRQAILDCLKRYTRGVDRHDEDLIRSAFWPDAVITYSRPMIREEFVKWVNPMHAGKFVQNQHHVTGQTVEIDGDVAHVESYVVYFLLAGKKTTGSNTIGSARYIERYERRKGEWKIAVREFIPDVLFEGATSVDLCPEPLGCRGKRDRTDLSYLRPLTPQTNRTGQPGTLPDRK